MKKTETREREDLQFAIADLQLKGKAPSPASSIANCKLQIANPKAFTLVELLTVIGIIAILVGILLPVVGSVRKAGYSAKTQALISSLAAGIERYQQDFGAYPGPLLNSEVYSITLPTNSSTTGFVTSNATNITMAENLVLGLCGGLKINSGTVNYDPSLVGQGPRCLNKSTNTNKTYQPYADANPLSWQADPTNGNNQTGHFFDDSAPLPGGASDSIIPEYVDGYPDPMPILYLRAKPGATGIIATGSGAQYDLNQIIGYTTNNIGVSKTLSSSSYKSATYPQHGLKALGAGGTLNSSSIYPYQALSYFTNFTISSSTPRQKDGYILISAGSDRVYGTDDDITNFGSVK